MWAALRVIARHCVVVSVATTAAPVGVMWAEWFVIRERFGEDSAALYGIVVPGVLVLAVIAITIMLYRRHATLMARMTGGTLTVVEPDVPLGETANRAAPWFRERGFEFAGSWCTALDGASAEELLGAAHYVRQADGVIAHVGDHHLSFSTGLSDGRELVTATGITLEVPGQIVQCVESGDLDTIEKIHAEGLSIFAADGVTAVEPLPIAVGQLRGELKSQALVRNLGPAAVARMTQRNLRRRIGTLADGGALRTPIDPSTVDRQRPPTPARSSPLPGPPTPPSPPPAEDRPLSALVGEVVHHDRAAEGSQ